MSDHEIQKVFGGFTEEALESLPVGTVVMKGDDLYLRIVADDLTVWMGENRIYHYEAAGLIGATLVALPVAPDVEDRVSAYLDRRLNDGPIDELPTIYDNDGMAEEIMAIVRGEW